MSHILFRRWARAVPVNPCGPTAHRGRQLRGEPVFTRPVRGEAGKPGKGPWEESAGGSPSAKQARGRPCGDRTGSQTGFQRGRWCLRPSGGESGRAHPDRNSAFLHGTRRCRAMPAGPEDTAGRCGRLCAARSRTPAFPSGGLTLNASLGRPPAACGTAWRALERPWARAPLRPPSSWARVGPSRSCPAPRSSC